MVGAEPLGAGDLRDDLVAAALDTEAIDVVATEHRAEVGADQLQVQPQRRHPVAIKHNLGLGLIKFQIGIRVHEQAALERAGDQLLAYFMQLPRLRGRGNHKLHRELAAARQRRRCRHNHLHARNGAGLAKDLTDHLLGRARAFAPRFGHHAGKAKRRKGNLEGILRFRQRMEHVVDQLGIAHRLINRGIRRALDDAEDHALVFLRGQFAPGHHQEREHQQNHDHRQRQRHRLPAQRASEHLRIPATHHVEVAINHAGKAGMRTAGPQQFRRHHRRQRDRHHPGHADRAGQRQRKLAEQRPGQSALKPDRRIHRRQCDRHRDDRTEQLPAAANRRLPRRTSFVQVALDVFDHHNRIVHHQPHRQHNRQQRQQVQREAEDQHQKHRADQRNRNRHHRNQHGPQRPEKQKNHHHHDQ